LMTHHAPKLPMFATACAKIAPRTPSGSFCATSKRNNPISFIEASNKPPVPIRACGCVHAVKTPLHVYASRLLFSLFAKFDLRHHLCSASGAVGCYRLLSLMQHSVASDLVYQGHKSARYSPSYQIVDMSISDPRSYT